MRDHEKLEAFQLAGQLALAIYKATCSFPEDERFGLVAQLRRAAVSVASNIVEGAAKHSKVDYARFIGIAYGSAKELRLGYMRADSSEQVRELATRSAKALWSLQTALMRN